MARKTTTKRKTRRKAPARPKTALAIPAPLPRAPVARRKPRTSAAQKARRTAQKAVQIAKTPIQLSHVAAGVAGVGASVYASSVVVDRGWLSPEWTAVAMSLAGVGATYAAYRTQSPHAFTAGIGWTAGSLGHGWMAHHMRAKHERELAQLAAQTQPQAHAQAQLAAGQPPKQLTDGRNRQDIVDAELVDDLYGDYAVAPAGYELDDERQAELEDELADARLRLTAGTEIAA